MFKTENDIINYVKQEKDFITWHDIQDITEGFVIGKYGNQNIRETFKKVDEILAKLEPIYYEN